MLVKEVIMRRLKIIMYFSFSFVKQKRLIFYLIHFVEYLGKELEDHVAKLSVPTKVLRTGKRSGLIRARLIGADQVHGEVIIFLDAHCECTKGWLEPLLARIAEDRFVHFLLIDNIQSYLNKFFFSE